MDKTEMQKIENRRFGEERALYGSRGLWVCDCAFDGEEDGESALKESREITVERCYCNLRYPFWHDRELTLSACEMTEKCRAALWYSEGISIRDCRLHGTKALRECRDVTIERSDVRSAEFGWSVSDLRVRDTDAEGEYFLLRAENVRFSNVHFKGKYSFQYVENAVLEDCVLDTKDAFWHAKNVTLRRCEVRGEYLAWYAKSLTMEDCKISGTQPFCYCEDLRLINCSLTDADLCFEKSDVDATLTTPVISIKNPRSGVIRVPAAKEQIFTDAQAKGKIVIQN